MAPQAILSIFRYQRGTIILESPHPCTVPHIVISDALPQPPTIAWDNSVPDPQDHGFGRYLTVMGRSVSYVNDPAEDEAWKWWGGEVEEADMYDMGMDTDLESCPDSPVPVSPLPLEGEDFAFPIVDVKDKYEDAGVEMNTYVGKSAVSPPSPAVHVEDQDDDDSDLPPFDDWYLAVLERTRHLQTS
jgi:hypothetical protein